MISPDFNQMRRAMIDSQLRTSGVNAAWILEAMGSAHREDYVPADRAATAYMDRSIPLDAGRMLNPPLATGLMFGAAEITPEDKILLIGSSSGYLIDLLARRAAHVTALEEQTSLSSMVPAAVSALPNVTLANGALSKGYADGAPYSLIIIDGAVDQVPAAITAQLIEGGRLVTGKCNGAVRQLAIGYRWGETLALRTFADCEIAALPQFAALKEFTF